MDRREFLTRGSMLVSGAVLAAISGLSPRRIFARDLAPFSIDVVTDRPDPAIRKIERILQNAALRQPSVRFSEHLLHGSHTGDIAFVRSQQLIDFRRADDGISAQLREAAAALDLPKTVIDPVLLRFYTEGPALRPTEAAVFCGDVLVRKLPLDTPRNVHRIDGMRGHVDIAVGDHSAAIVSATCKHKTCTRMGAITRPGRSLICIPNQITVAITGTSPLGIDAITS